LGILPAKWIVSRQVALYLSLAEAVERVGQLADVAVQAGNVEVFGLDFSGAGGRFALAVAVRSGRGSAHRFGC